jgi:hypothetical protein
MAELSQHLKGFCENERLWLEESMNRVRGSEELLGWEEPHRMCEFMNARQEWVQPSAGKDRLCNSYHEMMSI